MEQKFNNWLKQIDDKSIEAEDASNYAQCFDLAFNWCDFLNIPRDSIRHLNAYQIFTQPNPDTGQYWDLIGNTPTGVPQIGDLVIWGTSVGPAGHVAIFKEGDTNSFRSEDQNWSGIQKARLINHSYSGVLGWLRPKSAVIAQPTVQSNPASLIPLNEIYLGILGTNASPDEIDARASQLASGTALHDIVSQVLNEDGRSPLVITKQNLDNVAQQLKDLQNKPINPTPITIPSSGSSSSSVTAFVSPPPVTPPLTVPDAPETPHIPTQDGVPIPIKTFSYPSPIAKLWDSILKWFR